MRGKIYITILFLAICGIVSCGKDPIIKDTEHTLFIYMPWSSNLTSYFHQNIEDFEKAVKKGVLKENRVVVFFMSSPSKAALFELKYDKGNCIRDTLKEYTNPAFTTANGISSILNDIIGFAPAKRYSMTISCHGLGWLPVSSASRSTGQKNHWEYEGVPLTRFFGGTTSEYQTDITTLAEGIANAGLKMEYILFDDCYMSSIEVAYDLKDVTHYLIGCPTEVMAYGYPYADIAQHLIGNINYSGIRDGFISFYNNYTIMPCGTIGVIDCSQIENLASVMREINQIYTLDPALRNDIQPMCGYFPVLFFDMGDYVAKLCPDSDLLSKFEDQLERTVPSMYKGHTSTYYSASRGQVIINSYSGVTISDPSTNPRASLKTETAWYKATH